MRIRMRREATEEEDEEGEEGIGEGVWREAECIGDI